MNQFTPRLSQRVEAIYEALYDSNLYAEVLPDGTKRQLSVEEVLKLRGRPPICSGVSEIGQSVDRNLSAPVRGFDVPQSVPQSRLAWLQNLSLLSGLRSRSRAFLSWLGVL